MKTSEVFADAQKEILARGWGQNRAVSATGEICVTAALSLACGAEIVTVDIGELAGIFMLDFDAHYKHDCYRNAQDLLLYSTILFNPDIWSSLPSWNDYPRRTVTEVLEALHNAEIEAKELEGRHGNA